MAKNQDPGKYALVAQIAEMLKVDLKDTHIAVATQEQNALARRQDGSLEVTVFGGINRPAVRIESPLNPGIQIEMVDHQRDSLAPKGAIYRISSYMLNPADGRWYMLNGDVHNVYVGKEGIILRDFWKK